ncbi:MAG: alpha-L-rhamnosidase N-terminal domain-containing protein [Clostridiaceae bacterium]|nr:alpha-L-rhamnosidase N-terminal domain-containing protein [Clostridiaceae bacterium]
MDLDAQNSIVWRGRWIQNHKFSVLPYRNIYSGLRNMDNASELRNIHTFYRRQYRIKNTPIKSARLYITTDDTYKLYINGELAGLGPAQSFPFAYNYNTLDVTDFLKSGEDVVFAVHVYYLGLFTHSYLSADNLEGMIFQLEVEYDDGSMDRMVSDSSWKYCECGVWTGTAVYGYTTQFTEDMDMRKYPRGWRNKDFNDSNWTPVYVRAAPYPSPYTMVPQSIPTLDFIYLRVVIFPTFEIFNQTVKPVEHF